MTDRKPDGGPAYPATENHEYFGEHGFQGMTLRQYAAIELRVPDSGIDWLDAMIREGKRDWFAGQALAGLVGPLVGKEVNDEWVAKCAYEIADAMIAERDK